MEATNKMYDVHATFKNPAWDEKDGFHVTVYAKNKAEAVRRARSKARDAGHVGVMYFKATVSPTETEEYI